MALCDYTKTIDDTPLSPEDHIPLMEVKYHPTILKDRFAQFAGLDFFNPEVTVVSRDLQISHSLIVRFENTENPFDLVNVSDVTYKKDASCPPVMDMPCTEGCISQPGARRKSASISFIVSVLPGVSKPKSLPTVRLKNASARA